MLFMFVLGVFIGAAAVILIQQYFKYSDWQE